MLSGKTLFAISEKALWDPAKLQTLKNCRLHVFAGRGDGRRWEWSESVISNEYAFLQEK